MVPGFSSEFVRADTDVIDSRKIDRIIALVQKIFQGRPLARLAYAKGSIQGHADNIVLFTDALNQVFGPDDSVYTVDDGDHTVCKFTPDGNQRMVIGNPLIASETGYKKEIGLSSIIRGGSSFNGPKGVAIAPSGESYVTDGYGNARRHRFTNFSSGILFHCD